MKKSQSNRIRFNSVGVQTILRFLVSIKSFRHNKKLTFDLFAEQKTKFQKIFRGMRDFLELQCLVDDLVDFLELSMFIDAYLPEVYYLMKWIVDFVMNKTFCYIPFISVFFLKSCVS